VFDDHWTQHYGKYNDRNQTVLAKVSDFFAEHNEPIVKTSSEQTPPWLIVPPRTDDQLAGKISKHEAPEILLALSKDVIQSYCDHVHIYTDASKTTKSALAAMYKEATRIQKSSSRRVTDQASVFAGEMAAVHTALQTAEQLNSYRPLAIFSDSLSAIRCIKHQHSTSRPKMLQAIYERKHELNRNVTLVWIPSHIGIRGNELADRLANEGASRHAVDMHIGLEITEMYSAVDDYCRDKWQQECCDAHL